MREFMGGRWAALQARGLQRGATVTLGITIWLPVVILVMLLGVVGYNTWAYARELVQGAAEIGAQQAALSPASVDRGEAAATKFLADHGSVAVGDVHVTATITGTTVTVTVTGDARGSLGKAVPGVVGESAAALEPTP